MGVESRDWHREGSQRRRSLVPWLLGALIVFAALFIVSSHGRQALGLESARLGGKQEDHHDLELSLFPGTPKITIHKSPLYAVHDPWRSYLADEHTCPGGERTDVSLAQQAQTMLCLIDWARQRAGLSALPQISLLQATALLKASEIVRCHNFAHAACGGDPAADLRESGYDGGWGENLYIAGGRYGAPRPALDGWLNSPEHRENLLRAEWRTQGIAVIKLDRFGAYQDMTLWVSHFGSE